MKRRMKLKNDKYRKNIGGSSKLLALSYSKCRSHITYYQKDGAGIIKRLYLDRIHPENKKTNKLSCSKCKVLLGMFITYKKEGRPAYGIFVGAMNKKLVVADAVK